MIKMSLFAVVLAAGEASRFGATKQLARFRGEPLVARTMRAVESVVGAQSVLVVGKDHLEVARAAAPLMGFLAVNEDYKQGISTSIRTGVERLGGVADAVLIVLADQPLVDASHLASLAADWRSAPNRIVTSRYAGTTGPPVIFPAAYFDALMLLSGDRGAKAVIEDNLDNAHCIDCAAAAIDIDRPADLEAI